MSPEFPSPRTAIVTGGARRIGAAIVDALLEDGWHVLVHCRDSTSEAEARFGQHPAGRIVRADLGDAGAAERIFERMVGLPPLALLVNNASRFVHDSADDFSVEAWDAHMDVNLRAPAFLSQAFALALPDGAKGLIVNLLDAKLAAPNPDFFSYTVSKMGLAGLTELTARAFAGRGIRVCAIAPSVTMVSGPQARANFDAVHALNALGRGVDVADIVRALRFIIASPTLTGQTVTLDGGQRFLRLDRDVQFLET